MDPENEILPHQGVGDVRFGMDRAAVRALLGEPDSKDSDSVPDWESWAYSDRGLEITFDADESNRCTYLQVSDAAFHVGGVQLLGLELAAIERMAENLGLGEGGLAEAEEGEETLEFPAADLEIHFDGGRSYLVGISAEIDDADEFRFPYEPQE